MAVDVGALLLEGQLEMKADDAEEKRRAEEARRKKAGAWGGIGSLLGGGAGLLGAMALGLNPVGWGLAGIGALAGMGSAAGSGIATNMAGGMQDQATSLGTYEDILTGGQREYSKREQKDWRQNISDWSDDLNTRIITKAVNTGIKAAAFAGFNPETYSGAQSYLGGGPNAAQISAADAGQQALVDSTMPMEYNRNVAGFSGGDTVSPVPANIAQSTNIPPVGPTAGNAYGTNFPLSMKNLFPDSLVGLTNGIGGMGKAQVLSGAVDYINPTNEDNSMESIIKNRPLFYSSSQ